MKKLFLILTMLLLPLVAMKAQTAGENIDVTHYEIHLNELDFTNRTLQAETFVDLMATAQVQQIVLELKYLEISSVTATGAAVSDFSQSGDFLIINLTSPLANGSTATFDIVYGGSTFSETWGGVEWWGTNYVYNLGVGFDSQPHNLGKAWFPCVDNFTDKATYDVFVTTTNDKKAICGGNHVETFDNGDGTSTWYWNTPQEIATYHISFIVGDLVLWEDVYHGMERDIPIEVYTTPGLSDRVEATFGNIHEIVAFFEENLGPYPFNRIGYLSTSKGCMEHTDNIALATSVISGNTDYEEYLAHELSHMWSGNLVTCAEAGDMWLNEGFAQFWGAFYEVGVYGEEHFQNTISALVNSINTWCNNANNWMPLNNMPLDMTYDGDAIYDRGAVIVNTMMNYMGRENFLSAMRQYFDQYAYQTATSDQLRDALTQYSGIDMSGFFDSYVFSSGMPHLYATIREVNPVGNQFEVTLDLRYQHIGDSHIGQNNKYDITFIGPDFQLVTEKVSWDGLHENTTVILDFEPIGMVNDFNNNWLDGRTQKNMMLKSTSQESFAHFIAKPNAITDSVFVSVENHLVEPYDNPLIPDLNLSTKHFWTINRYDFGEAEVEGWFDYSKNNDGDIIQTLNDSATLLYRRNATEAWHEIAYTLYPGSSWKQGRFIVDDIQSGEYAIAAWDKECLGQQEFAEPEKAMKLFPNPATEQLNVRWNEVSDGQILICDGQGKALKQIGFLSTNRMTIYINDLPKGWYSVVRMNKNGTIIETQILIVK
jgi:aminopeptidase N